MLNRTAKPGFLPLWFTSIVTAALITAGCGGADERGDDNGTTPDTSSSAPAARTADDPPPDRSPTIDLSTTGIVEQVPCDDGSSCVEAFGLNGSIYASSCRLVDPDQVDIDNLLGHGWAFGREIQARPLRLDPTFSMIAITAPPQPGCGESPTADERSTTWQFAWTGDPDTSVICAAGLHTPVEAAADGCDE